MHHDDAVSVLRSACHNRPSGLARCAGSWRQLLVMKTTCDCVSTNEMVTRFAVSRPMRPPSSCCTSSVASAATAHAVRLPSSTAHERNSASISTLNTAMAARLKLRKSSPRFWLIESTTYGTPASDSKKSSRCWASSTRVTDSISLRLSAVSTASTRLVADTSGSSSRRRHIGPERASSRSSGPCVRLFTCSTSRRASSLRVSVPMRLR